VSERVHPTTEPAAEDGALPEELRALLDGFHTGRRTALARAISLVENGSPAARPLLAALHPRTGRARRIGITGPPGAGKSTLVAALVAAYRARGETVAVVAVDPTSPYTGGALLGDRIRLGEATLDPGVFMRSMATRGSLGGLARTTREAVDLMDAFGFDRVLIETVGVGQTELDIAATADTVAVVLVPESGDAVQAMKAGLMEIADIFIINKADRPGAERLAREVQTMLHLRQGEVLRNIPAHHGVDLRRVRPRTEPTAGPPEPPAGPPEPPAGPPEPPAAWTIPVLQTVAETGQGVDELVAALDRHRAWLEASGALAARRRARLAGRVREEVERRLLERAWRERGGEALLEAALPALEAGETTPDEVAARIVRAATG